MNFSYAFLNSSGSRLVNSEFKLSSNPAIFRSPFSSTSNPNSLLFLNDGVNALEFVAESDNFFIRVELGVDWLDELSDIWTLSSSSTVLGFVSAVDLVFFEITPFDWVSWSIRVCYEFLILKYCDKHLF